LGVYKDLVIADIPGIIEGASTGKGLGIKFLRHVERTKTLFHLISAESSTLIKDYKAIRKELGKYNKTLLEKREFIFLTKSDMVSEKDLAKKLAKLKKINPQAIAISIYNYDSIQGVNNVLEGLNKEKQA
jgi:GTP-binding protein